MRPLTNFLPKCLMPINGRPLLEYWVKPLSEAGIGPILINLHYYADIVQEWVQNSEFADNVMTVYEEELLGTGGTPLRNQDFVNDEPVMLIHADNLSLVNLEEFIQTHMTRPLNTEITMMTFTTLTPETCGIVEVDAHGVVQAFHEKVSDPPGNLANAAVYIVEPQVINFLAGLNKTVIDFSTEVLPHYLCRIYTYHNDFYHRDIGSLKSLLDAQIEFPGQVFISQHNDPWEKICKKNIDSSRKVLLSLADQFEAKVIDVDDECLHLLPKEYCLKEKKLILNVKKSDLDLKKILQHLQEQGSIREGIILYFSKVSPGFSSKKIFEEHGVKSLAMCACT